MTQLSKEKLVEIRDYDTCVTLEESAEMARRLLAAEAQEPVSTPELHKIIYHFRDLNEGFPVERFKADYVISWMLANYPPAQPVAVPEECPVEIRDLIAAHSDALLSDEDVQEIWNACRAAMLQGKSEPVSQPYTLPQWIPCSERMPEETGRYWCYVEEQNDLGKSHYQWNCSWNGNRWWVESENGGRVTHWQPLPSAPQEPTK